MSEVEVKEASASWSFFVFGLFFKKQAENSNINTT